MSEISSGIQESVVSQPKQETADALKGIGISKRVEVKKLTSSLDPKKDPKTMLEEIAKGEFPQGSEKHDVIAETTGTFYVDMLETFLREGNTSNESREQIDKAIEKLPERLKKVYKGIAERVEKRLATNKAELESLHVTTPQEKVRALFTAYTDFLLKDEDSQAYTEDKRQFLESFLYDDMSFSEPTEGMFIIETGDTAFQQLFETGVLEGDAKAAYIPVEPGFIIVPKTFNEEDIGTTKKGATIHELHHLIHKEMEKAQVRVKPENVDQQTWDNFDRFSDEIGGYLLSHKGLVHVRTTSLLKTDDPPTYYQASQLHKQIALSIEIAKAAGKDSSIFLYPTFRANSFDDLEKRIDALVPQSTTASVSLVDALYTLTKQEDTDRKTLTEQFRQKDVHVTPEVAQAFAENNLEGDTPLTLLKNAQETKVFLNEISSPPITDQTFLLERLQQEVSLPPDTLTTIIRLYETNAYFHDKIALALSNAPSAEDFLMKTLHLSDLADPNGYAVWQEIIHSSTQTTDALTHGIDQLLITEEKTAKSNLVYMFADEQGKQQIDQQFEQNSQLLRQLVSSQSS